MLAMDQIKPLARRVIKNLVALLGGEADFS